LSYRLGSHLARALQYTPHRALICKSSITNDADGDGDDADDPWRPWPHTTMATPTTTAATEMATPAATAATTTTYCDNDEDAGDPPYAIWLNFHG